MNDNETKKRELRNEIAEMESFVAQKRREFYSAINAPASRSGSVDVIRIVEAKLKQKKRAPALLLAAVVIIVLVVILIG